MLMEYINTGKKYNGYFVGKRWVDLTVSMWKEDIEKRLLFKSELYDDPTLPNWFLNKVLKNMRPDDEG